MNDSVRKAFHIVNRRKYALCANVDHFRDENYKNKKKKKKEKGKAVFTKVFYGTFCLYVVHVKISRRERTTFLLLRLRTQESRFQLQMFKNCLAAAELLNLISSKVKRLTFA